MSPTLGEIIRNRRELAELPLRQFASMVGISGPYLSQIERGLRAPSDRVLEAIAASLRTTADALRGESASRQRPSAVLAAIAEDPRLSPRHRQALSEVYLAFVASADAGRGGGRR
ncbi:helix-turn-helix domain-containing protein [Paractinoplanes atraurantiacus]|uniref:Transcriptional regulator, contains XRE-family HTH domain n=1 Tax=Paractinoplanes atraurantiacus TaxID=1036182 RepID=A0A285JG94_9ACTN|nr:helix-turn-helix transcriptional regulator [Actinoplanes atraurantiacus]SNY59093.1 Transcriptional regulator, contains XRE-family HTH domain [Actinoplanes atraurantiacus]